MRKVTLALIAGVSMVVGAASAAVAAKAEPAAGGGCPNTWCAPDDRQCDEVTGWSCRLSGGCSGTDKCDPIEDGD